MIGHKAPFLKEGRLEFCLFLPISSNFFPNLECFAKIFNITIKTPALVYFGEYFFKRPTPKNQKQKQT